MKKTTKFFLLTMSISLYCNGMNHGYPDWQHGHPDWKRKNQMAIWNAEIRRSFDSAKIVENLKISREIGDLPTVPDYINDQKPHEAVYEDENNPYPCGREEESDTIIVITNKGLKVFFDHSRYNQHHAYQVHTAMKGPFATLNYTGDDHLKRYHEYQKLVKSKPKIYELNF